jgi:hypothetical protein
MRQFIRAGLVCLALAAIVAATVTPAWAAGETEVSVGSPDGPFSRNKQNEPAVTVNPSHPFLVGAAANDNIDMEGATPETTPRARSPRTSVGPGSTSRSTPAPPGRSRHTRA